jgi:hypothetical protein
MPPSLPLLSDIPPSCAPGPIPTQISCGTIEIHGERLVAIQTANASGVRLDFLPPAVAREIAKNLEAAAAAALEPVTARTFDAGIFKAPETKADLIVGRADGTVERG